MSSAKVEWENETWPDNGSIWYGRNTKKFGGQFYIGIATGHDVQSVCIPPYKQPAVAQLLRRLADRMDPPGGERDG